MKKIILLINLLIYPILAFTLTPQKVKNANTVLVQITKKDISDAKLSFEKQNLKMYPNPFKQDSFYALLPISYYQKLGKYRVIISYLKDGKRVFEGKTLEVIDGKYKSETINVPKSKFKPPKARVQRTKKEYNEAMKVYNTDTSKILWSSDFINPLNSKITSPFGTKRVYNGQLKSYHSGTDYKAKTGTPIKASNSGVVKIARSRFYSGGSIIIDHGQGIYSCYFHLSKLNKKVGDKVKKGEIIGLSGSTGRVTGPHLHLSFRVHGTLVNPLQVMEILNTLKP